MGGPSRVADTGSRAVGRIVDRTDELGQLAGATAPPHTRCVVQCHAGGVVAAVLEPGQALEQDRQRRLRTGVANDAAHEVRGYRG